MSFDPQIAQADNSVDLDDLLRMFRKSLMLDFNCHHIGTIESFNGSKQTAEISINYKKTFFKANSNGILEPELKNYPVMIDVPVIFLGGGGFSLTFPVKNGDECLVFFNDRDIDTWFSGTNHAPNATPRLHSFADGIALVGLRSLRNSITSFATDAVELRNRSGNIRVSLKNDKMDIIFGSQNTIHLTSSSAKIAVGSSMSFEITGTGKLKVTNGTGEFVSALVNFLQTANAGGFPIVGDYAALESFKE